MTGRKGLGDREVKRRNPYAEALRSIFRGKRIPNKKKKSRAKQKQQDRKDFS